MCAVWFLGVSLGAQASTEVDRLFEQGRALMAEGRVDEACPLFERSHSLEPALGTLLNLADCYERQRRFERAHRRFVEAARWAARRNETKREEVARARARALEPSVVLLEIDTRRVSATATIRNLATEQPEYEGPVIDHEPIALEPGQYAVKVVAVGFLPFESRLDVARTGQVTVVADFRPIESPPEKEPRTGLLIGGVAGGIVGALGVLAIVVSQLTFAAVMRQQPGGSMALSPTVTRAEYEFAQVLSPPAVPPPDATQEKVAGLHV
jgi:hypothetical protein